MEAGGDKNMATAFTRRGAAPEQVSAAEVDKLHSKIGRLVVEQNLLATSRRHPADAPAGQWMPRTIFSGREAKNGEPGSQAERPPPMCAANADAVQSLL